MKPYHLVIASFGLFMAFILVLVVKTYYVNTELVSQDYYQQELDYQGKIDKMAQSKIDSSQVSWQLENNQVVLTFPKNVVSENVTGKIEFYRPSDSSKDIVIPVQLDGNQSQSLNRKLFVTGLYKVKVDWATQGKEYYTEEYIYIQ